MDIINKEGKYDIIGVIDSVNEIGSEDFGYKVIPVNPFAKGEIILVGDSLLLEKSSSYI